MQGFPKYSCVLFFSRKSLIGDDGMSGGPSQSKVRRSDMELRFTGASSIAACTPSIRTLCKYLCTGEDEIQCPFSDQLLLVNRFSGRIMEPRAGPGGHEVGKFKHGRIVNRLGNTDICPGFQCLAAVQP